MTAIIISSQRYLDDDTVTAKIAADDFTVTLSPEFVVNGETYQTVIDGHHSYAAAIESGVSPVFIIASERDDDRIYLLDSSVDDYLEASYVDSDWYDIRTGWTVF